MDQRIGYLLLMCLLFTIACQQDGNKDGVIDPSKVKIDFETGGILSSDNTPLAFRKVGKGEEIIVIPNGTYLAEDFGQLADQFTLIFYDTRNRGRSGTVKNEAKISKGIFMDIADLEDIRQHFEIEKLNLLGHDYLGWMIGYYSVSFPDRVGKIVQIGTLPPDINKKYGGRDIFQDSLAIVYRRELAALNEQEEEITPEAYCEKWWAIQRKMFVVDQSDKNKVTHTGCNYPNEKPQHINPYLSKYIFPTMRQISPDKLQFQKIEAPVLVVHGSKDRVAPIGGAKEWIDLFPDAKLLELKDAGHMPWIENGPEVMTAIREFFGPELAEEDNQ